MYVKFPKSVRKCKIFLENANEILGPGVIQAPTERMVYVAQSYIKSTDTYTHTLRAAVCAVIE